MKKEIQWCIYHDSQNLEKLFDAIEKKRKEYEIDREKLYWTIKEEEERHQWRTIQQKKKKFSTKFFGRTSSQNENGNVKINVHWLVV